MGCIASEGLNCFRISSWNPLERTFRCCFFLLSFLVVLTFLKNVSFLSTHFSHILFLNPHYFHLGLSDFCAINALISFVFFIYPFLAGWFFVCFSCVSCSAFSLWPKTRFPCNSGVSTTGLTICDTRRLCPAILDFFLRFPPKALFQNPSLFFCCQFFCLPFQHSTFNPFWDNIVILFFDLSLLSHVLSSLVLLYFKQVSGHRLLRSNFVSFLVVRLFSSSYLKDIVFRFGVSLILCFSCWFCLVFLWLSSPFFSLLVCLLFFCVGLCFVLVACVILVSDYDKEKCFPAVLVFLGGRVGLKPIEVRWSCDIRKITS